MNKSALLEPEVKAPAKPGRQELRIRETRELLLSAAKTIFIRDGYEGADLNDIAELAGRTKGAIYGHFKSKEDIFLALMVKYRCEYRANLAQLLTDDPEENIAVMRRFVVSLTDDSAWALLQLEFKMFTLRHPETKKTFEALYPQANAEREEAYEAIFGPAGKRKGSVSRGMALHSVIPMLSALLLEAEFDPGLMSKSAIKKLIAGVFDCMLTR
ncbi:TetR/AcrR family transcriptional regulator [Terriglobus roseus]|uniref:Transcriptional regulator, TetR family n=1 Tax=Terriglobus roseus TaxID=392734 RepID=A0A1H4Q5S2_9BACT|nr:TetR/AcrR family transcriptional regulator [Terriglobus roseus]SEC14964.1 transcriptional regulator, TetR family [Terriglobus roseus]